MAADNSEEQQSEDSFLSDWRRGTLWTIGVLVGVLGLWFLITGLLGWRAASNVQSAGTEMTQLMRDGKVDEAVELLPKLRDSASSANARFNSVPWSWAADFPIVESTIKTVGAVAGGTDAIAGATANHDAAILESAKKLDADGAAGIAGLVTLAPILDAASANVTPYQEAVAAIPENSIIPIGGVRSARTQLLDTANGVEAASGAARALPVMLGTTEAARKWLVAVQNTAEAAERVDY